MSRDNKNYLQLSAGSAVAVIDLNDSMILHGVHVDLECND